MKARETAIMATAIEERKRSLSAQLVVSLVVAISFWLSDSMTDVLKNLIDRISELQLKISKY